MPTHPPSTKPVQQSTSQTPSPNGTKRRPGPPKPVTFKDFASI